MADMSGLISYINKMGRHYSQDSLRYYVKRHGVYAGYESDRLAIVDYHLIRYFDGECQARDWIKRKALIPKGN